jgi:hypothetical protein
MIRTRIKWLGIALATAALAAAGALSASAASAATTVTGPQVCVMFGPSGNFTSAGNYMLWDWNRSACQRGTYAITLPTGPQGPSGVTATQRVTGSATLAHIGGSWTVGHTMVKQVSLPKGTYLVTLNGDFYKTATTTATPDLQIQLNGADHQVTGYTDQFPYNAAEGVGATSGSPNGLELNATSEDTIVLAAPATLEIDAFGYNADRSGNGGGDFAVNASASFTQITPAS